MRNFYIILLIHILAGSPTFAQYFGGSGDGYSFASVGSAGGEVPLPVELIYFSAKSIGGRVNVNWATASETNSDYFSIERSANSIDFKLLGTVNGAGNSSQKKEYLFSDEEPLMGNAYYRLKQTDFDGKSEYFNIAAVLYNINKPDIQVYPNPNNGNFVIVGGTPNADLIITDSQGEKIVTKRVTSSITNVDLSNSANGIYYVYISSEKELTVKKIIITH